MGTFIRSDQLRTEYLFLPLQLLKLNNILLISTPNIDHGDIVGQ